MGEYRSTKSVKNLSPTGPFGCQRAVPVGIDFHGEIGFVQFASIIRIKDIRIVAVARKLDRRHRRIIRWLTWAQKGSRAIAATTGEFEQRQTPEITDRLIIVVCISMAKTELVHRLRQPEEWRRMEKGLSPHLPR